jgi:hypothetical protein
MELAEAQVQPRYIVLDLSGGGLRRRLGPPPPAAGVPPDAPAMALDQAHHHRTRRSGAEDDLATSRPMIQSGAAMARSVRAETSGAGADADAVYGAGTSGSEAAEEESGDEADSFDASFCQEGFARKIEALAELVGMDGACEPVAVLSEVVRVLRSIDTHRHSEYIPCASD